jgi:hypothetical protein
VAQQEFNSPSWIVTQKDEAWRIEKIYALLKKNDEDWEEFGGDAFYIPRTSYHVNLGRLLGYEEDDINYHMNWTEKKRQQLEDERLARVAAWKRNHETI